MSANLEGARALRLGRVLELEFSTSSIVGGFAIFQAIK